MDFWKYTFFGGFEFSVCCYVTLCMGSLCGCFEELKSCCCRVFFSFRSAIFFVFLWNFRLWFYCIWWWLAETKKLVCCIFRFYFLFFFISNCNIIYNSYLNAWFGYLVFFFIRLYFCLRVFWTKRLFSSFFVQINYVAFAYLFYVAPLLYIPTMGYLAVRWLLWSKKLKDFSLFFLCFG